MENKDFMSPRQSNDEKGEKAFEALQKEFVVVGKTHVRPWQAWLMVGVITGIIAGVFLVANRSGEFSGTLAGSKDIKVAVEPKKVGSGDAVTFSIATTADVHSVEAEFKCKDGVTSLEEPAYCSVPKIVLDDLTGFSAKFVNTTTKDVQVTVKFKAYDVEGERVGGRKVSFKVFPASAATIGSAETPQFVPGEILVKLKSDAVVDSGTRATTESSISQTHQLDSLGLVLEKHRFEGDIAERVKKAGLDRLYVAKADSADDERTLQSLREDPRVEYVEPNYLVNTFIIPSDPNFSQLWGMHNTGQTGGVADADIDAPEAWDLVKTSEAVVGVIDTGVDYTHEDLAGNMWKNPGEIPDNGVDDDQNGFVDDVYGWDFVNDDNDPMDDMGHGTHVAGTIGALGNNGVGVTGVTWGAKIAAIKFLNSFGGGSIADAVAAVQYANMMGFKITNNSWGGGGFSQALYDAIKAADDKGLLFVAAAGNSFGDSDKFPLYPAAYNLPNIISVAATDHSDNKAFFSNYGLKSVDLGAPGVQIYSTMPTGSCLLCNKSGYGFLSGTSMASPHVAGVGALVWSYFPELSHTEVKGRILLGVEPIDALANKTVTGGRLNVNNLVEDDETAPAGVNNLKAVTETHSSVTLQWKAVGDDGIVGIASRYDLRYSTGEITESNFSSAIQVEGEPRPSAPGIVEKLKVPGLSNGTKYYFAVKVYDNMGNASPLSNVVSTKTKEGTVAFFDDIESGVGGWTVEGTDGVGGPALWHSSERRASSPSHAWYYGLEGDGNYDTGAVNFGTITSSEIDLSNIQDAELSFKHYLETEELPPFDVARVQLSKDGGVTWKEVFSSITTNGEWAEETIDIAGFDFSFPVKIRFSFHTLDPILNDFEGWYIDDIKISGLKSKNKPPKASINGPYSGVEDKAILFDGSGSFDPEDKPLTYKWDFGNGDTITTTKDKVFYAFPGGGEFEVWLTVNDGARDSKPVKGKANITEINDAPVAIPTKEVFVGHPVTFDGTGSFDIDTPITSYVWNLGEGIKEGRIVTHTYKAPGMYKVTLTVDDGELSGTRTIKVPVSLYDEFNRTDSTILENGWGEVSGGFEIEGGVLRNISEKGLHMAILPALSGVVFNAAADFKYEDTKGKPTFGLVLNYENTENYYLLSLQLKSKKKGELRISKVLNGEEEILAEIQTEPPAEGTPFRLGGSMVSAAVPIEYPGKGDLGDDDVIPQPGEAILQESQLVLVLDGVKRLSAVIDDNSFGKGTVGVFVEEGSDKGDSMNIDNFRAVFSTPFPSKPVEEIPDLKLAP